MAQSLPDTKLQGNHVTRRGEYRALRLPRRSFGDLFDEHRPEPPVRTPDSVPAVRDEETDVRSDPRDSPEERPEPAAPPDLPVVPPSPAAVVPAKPADGESVTESGGKTMPAEPFLDDPFLDYERGPAPAVVAAALSVAAALGKPAAFRPIDLRPYANQERTAPFPGGDPGNDLAGLPPGTHTLGGVEFAVGDAVVHLGSARVPGPQKVEGIAVGGRVAKLHVLHACDWSRDTAEGEVIARFVLHHEDGTAAEAPVVYGQHVRDWWSNAGEKDPPRSKLGWEGENEAVKASGARIKLWLTTWHNPHPGKSVVSIDYVAATAATAAAPFCVAITVEEG
jgi:hypothetical protein